MVIFFDTNVVIDYLSSRPQSEIAKQVMNICVEKNFDIFISATTVVNSFYIMRKDFSEDEMKDLFLNFLQFADVVGTSRQSILNSLKNSTFSDFEDCVQYECAASILADCIITRNVKDFENSEIPVFLPEDFLAKITQN